MSCLLKKKVLTQVLKVLVFQVNTQLEVQFESSTFFLEMRIKVIGLTSLCH